VVTRTKYDLFNELLSARGEVLLTAEEGLYVNSASAVNKNFIFSDFFYGSRSLRADNNLK